MKKLIFCLLVSFNFLGHAQSDFGIISFTEKIKLNMKFPEGMAPPANMPTETSKTKILYFTKGNSLYTNQTTKEENEVDYSSNQEQEGINFTFKMTDPRQEIFNNLSTGNSIEGMEFFGKDFLIEGPSKSFAWKVTGEQKSINGFNCMKATTIHQDTLNVIAWFTPQIQVSSGPQRYYGLPGMILEVEVPQLNQTITATKIDVETDPQQMIVIPTKGKKVTREQFEKIHAEKMEEMRQEYGGSGNVIIKTIKN